MGTRSLDAASSLTPRLRKPYKDYPLDKPWADLWKDSVEWYPILQVRVARGHGKPTHRFAVVMDTGSSFCLFRADVGRHIGLNIESGVEQQIGGVVSPTRARAFFHKITLYVEDSWTFTVTAGFVENLGQTGILGRRGFFDKFIVRLDHSCTPPALEIEKIPTVH